MGGAFMEDYYGVDMDCFGRMLHACVDWLSYIFPTLSESNSTPSTFYHWIYSGLLFYTTSHAWSQCPESGRLVVNSYAIESIS